jgi:hypothetical protein
MNHSIHTINADVAQVEFGARGQGIVWAVIGSGVESSHPHFRTWQNLVLPQGLSHWDTSHLDAAQAAMLQEAKDPVGQSLSVASDTVGHGTSVAAVIAGESSDEEGGILRGMAPQCKILSINVFGDGTTGTERNVLAALRTIQAINAGSAELRIHGVLLPLEMAWDECNWACGYSPVCVEVDRLVNTGVVVVASAGNRGFDRESARCVEGTISDPGNAPTAITVGSTHRTLPREYGPSYFSARGPTADGRLKPDLLAPGERIITCLAGTWAQKEGGATGRRDGTSYAAAHVAGAVAAILSVRPELIGHPQAVKDLLMRTAVDLKRERIYQGAGLVDIVAALRERRDAGTHASQAQTRRPLRVFCSYSHRDLSLWKEFEAHLSPMQRMKLIDVWSDQAIPTGTEWEPQIVEHLEAADVILLLVSSYFVDSDYCWSKEMERALQRHKVGAARVIPILARPVTLDGTPLAGLQMLPPGKRPVTSFNDPHEGWAIVAAKLRDVVMELRGAEAGGGASLNS